jgi:hypothetical protein
MNLPGSAIRCELHALAASFVHSSTESRGLDRSPAPFRRETRFSADGKQLDRRRDPRPKDRDDDE